MPAMTWRSLLFGDKTPLIIASALTVFGWYVNSISSYFTDETIIYVSPSKGNVKDEYLIKNVSLKNIAGKVFIQIQCVPFSNCLTAQGDVSENKFGSIEQIAPFAASSTQSCIQNQGSYQAQVDLPPGASVKISVTKKPGTLTDLFIVGQFTQPCDTSAVSSIKIRVEQYPSAIAFLLQNFITYYIASIVLLILVFGVTIARTGASHVQAQGDEAGHVAGTVNLDLTIHRDADSQPKQQC
jgi:hypothetical protein